MSGEHLKTVRLQYGGVGAWKALDADCSAAQKIEYFYRSNMKRSWKLQAARRS